MLWLSLIIYLQLVGSFLGLIFAFSLHNVIAFAILLVVLFLSVMQFLCLFDIKGGLL